MYDQCWLNETFSLAPIIFMQISFALEQFIMHGLMATISNCQSANPGKGTLSDCFLSSNSPYNEE